MKFIVFLAIAVTACVARPAEDATVLKYESAVNVDGYNFALQTSDGTNRDETGELKNAGAENEALVVRGSFSWIAPDGETYSINFTADETGYHPEGAHIPVAPEA